MSAGAVGVEGGGEAVATNRGDAAAPDAVRGQWPPAETKEGDAETKGGGAVPSPDSGDGRYRRLVCPQKGRGSRTAVARCAAGQILKVLRLFEEHSDLLELFERFRSLKTREEQASSMELAEHATTVMNSLDEAIRALDDADTFFTFVEQVGASHRRIPGFQPELFWKIEKPFLEAVKTTLGDRYTDNVDTLYRATIKLIIETLINGFNNAQDNPQVQQKEQSS
ncbi:myoglobin-like [Schistocerca piceifrons]|uniref:myoglobin-like n=1 Tax=Schistocerca piceifrons TaxID=274613 RepID=UPI001F5F7CDD|nr:myoglobin-like [Schistocerca piceifrons]